MGQGGQFDPVTATQREDLVGAVRDVVAGAAEHDHLAAICRRRRMVQRNRQGRPGLPGSGVRVVALHRLQGNAVAQATHDPDLVVEHGPRHHQSRGRRIRQRAPLRGRLDLAGRKLERFRRRDHLTIPDGGRPADRIDGLLHRGDGHTVPRGCHVRQRAPRLGHQVEHRHALEDLASRYAADGDKPSVGDGHAEVTARLRQCGQRRPGLCGRVVRLDVDLIGIAGGSAHRVHQLAVRRRGQQLPRVGIGAPRLHDVPSKTSVVFSSAPLASTPPATTRRSPTTAAAAAARGCSRCGSSTQRPLTTRQT